MRDSERSRADELSALPNATVELLPRLDLPGTHEDLMKRLAVAFSNLPQTYYNTRQIVTTREMFGDSTVTQQCFHASHLMESFDGVI